MIELQCVLIKPLGRLVPYLSLQRRHTHTDMNGKIEDETSWWQHKCWVPKARCDVLHESKSASDYFAHDRAATASLLLEVKL